MSSLGAKKSIKTYSRQKKHSLYDDEPATKRRRVDTTTQTLKDEMVEDEIPGPLLNSPSPTRDSSALPSSPKESPILFSDEPPDSSPPSSPVPPNPSPLPARKRRPMFSFLKRKALPRPSSKKPLSEGSDNVQSQSKEPPKQKRLVQMQLDLVADVYKTCQVCGMEYVPSRAEDVALHRKYHGMNVGGADISKAISEKLKQRAVWSGGERSFIAVVSKRDALALRNKASEVLEIVNTELGAIPISDEALWSQIHNSISTNASSTEGDARHAKKGNAESLSSDRFKAYLYIQGQKCVGACLAERIQEAFAVLGRDDASGQGHVSADFDSSCICVGEKREPAVLGISRIWTSNLHRKHGIATRLLDAARADFLYGMTINKAEVAFSQPTESGGQLARKWHGRDAGWLVYID